MGINAKQVFYALCALTPLKCCEMISSSCVRSMSVYAFTLTITDTPLRLVVMKNGESDPRHCCPVVGPDLTNVSILISYYIFKIDIDNK